jgi:hypothetical protein
MISGTRIKKNSIYYDYSAKVLPATQACLQADGMDIGAVIIL